MRTRDLSATSCSPRLTLIGERRALARAELLPKLLPERLVLDRDVADRQEHVTFADARFGGGAGGIDGVHHDAARRTGRGADAEARLANGVVDQPEPGERQASSATGTARGRRCTCR